MTTYHSIPPVGYPNSCGIYPVPSQPCAVGGVCVCSATNSPPSTAPPVEAGRGPVRRPRVPAPIFSAAAAGCLTPINGAITLHRCQVGFRWRRACCGVCMFGCCWTDRQTGTGAFNTLLRRFRTTPASRPSFSTVAGLDGRSNRVRCFTRAWSNHLISRISVNQCPMRCVPANVTMPGATRARWLSAEFTTVLCAIAIPLLTVRCLMRF